MTRMSCSLLSLLILAVLISSIANAWEADVHYGLTKWLAINAGFSAQDADIIAVGAESADEGRFHSAPWVVIEYACIFRDLGAAKDVQQNHFPSYADLPSPSTSRYVTPGSQNNAATRWVREEVDARPREEPADKTLFRFGRSLHPLQDSWSHQGEPDTPPWPCDDQLAWGHPKARGGYLNHFADLTYLHPDDLAYAAERTYYFLREFRKKHSLKYAGPPRPWKNIEGSVYEFARCRTKAEKKEWFDRNGHGAFVSTSFLRSIDLEGGGIHISAVSASLTPVKLQASVSYPRNPDISPEDQQLAKTKSAVTRFLTSWIVMQDLTSAARSVPHAAFFPNREVLSSGPKSNASDPVFFFAMWLVADHGALAAAGHGTDRSIKEFLPRDAQPPNPMILGGDISALPTLRFNTLKDAIQSPDGIDLFAIVPAREPTHYIVLFQFLHAPNDIVALDVTAAGENIEVSRYGWICL